MGGSCGFAYGRGQHSMLSWRTGSGQIKENSISHGLNWRVLLGFFFSGVDMPALLADM
jgi:hypothetical protein